MLTHIRMLKSFWISPDGLRVEHWRIGTEREIDDETLRLLINEGVCEIVDNKAVKAAPENKSRARRRK